MQRRPITKKWTDNQERLTVPLENYANFYVFYNFIISCFILSASCHFALYSLILHFICIIIIANITHIS